MKKLSTTIFATIIILFFSPYILTIFINGETKIPTFSNMLEPEITVSILDESYSLLWEEYLIGILAKEIPNDYSLEAMKAQAIIIRTRLATSQNGEEGYTYAEDYYTMVEIQQKWGENALEVYSQLKTAIQETDGMTLQYEGSYALVAYHYLNNGSTRDGNDVLLSDEYPYLQSVSCPLDIEHEDELTTVYMNYAELTSIFLPDATSDLTYEEICITETDDSGYVLTLTLGMLTISGETFRTELGLKSSSFLLQDTGNELKITTTGVGHGLGLSQNTAHYMGLEGKTYQEILAYFYPGTELISEN